jgi:hypothetical protein
MESREEEEEMQIKMWRRSKMVDCGNSYTPVATNYPEEGKSRDPKKAPMEFHNPQEIKLSLNPQTEKKLTMGRM